MLKFTRRVPTFRGIVKYTPPPVEIVFVTETLREQDYESKIVRATLPLLCNNIPIMSYMSVV